MLRRWCGSARRSNVCRAILGAGGPEKTKGSGAGGTGAGGEIPVLRVLEPEAPQYAVLKGMLLSRNIDSRMVLGWARRRKVIRAWNKLPPIDGKDGLTVTTTLQSRLIREVDML